MEDRLRLFVGEAEDVEHFAARECAARQRHSVHGQTECFGEECKQRFVGAAFDRWSMDGNLQLRRGAFAIDTDDCSFLRAGLRADGESDSSFHNAEHSLAHSGGPLYGARLPNRAVPMRMRVAPSSMASGKSPLMPMERTRRFSFGYDATQRSRLVRKLRKQARVTSSGTPQGAIVINPRRSSWDRSGRRSSSSAASAESGSRPAF